MVAVASNAGLHTSPIGGAATSVWWGKVDDLDENAVTRGENWRGRPGQQGESKKMLADPHVRGARDVVVDPVIAAEWDFEPGGGRPKDLEAADYCRHVFLERVPWKRHLGAMMRGYVEDGFAIVEETDDVAPISAVRFPLHPMGTRGVVITGFRHRPAWSITNWHQRPEDGEQLRAVTQFVAGSDVEKLGYREIPSERFLRATWEQSGANFEGEAPQRSAWGPWFVKRLLTKVEAMGHEKNHLAQPIAKKTELGTGSDDEDKKVEKILANFRAHEKGSMLLPFGYDVAWSQHGQQTNIGATIVRCNFDIAHNYLAGFMTLGQNATGSYALAGTQKGQFDLSLGKHGDFLCDVHNFGMDGWSIVQRITRLNYGEDVAVPRLVIRYLPTVDWEKVLPTLATLSEKGIIVRDDRIERFARKGLRAPEPDPNTNRDKSPREASGNIGAGKDIQTQLPNGAQVQSAVAIISQAAAGTISRESARAALIQFYGVSQAVADDLLGPADFVPRSAAPPVPPPPSEEPQP